MPRVKDFYEVIEPAVDGIDEFVERNVYPEHLSFRELPKAHLPGCLMVVVLALAIILLQVVAPALDRALGLPRGAKVCRPTADQKCHCHAGGDR